MEFVSLRHGHDFGLEIFGCYAGVWATTNLINHGRTTTFLGRAYFGHRPSLLFAMPFLYDTSILVDEDRSVAQQLFVSDHFVEKPRQIEL